MTQNPDDEEFLTSAVVEFLTARRRLYTAMETKRGNGTSANEVARQVAEALSRPPVLAYFNARDLAAVAAQVLETAHLSAAFEVAGPTPEQPRAKQVTLTMKLPLTETTDDPAELFFNLSVQFAYAGASLAAPANAEIPDPASLGLAEDSTPVTLLLAAGQPVLVTIGRAAHVGIPRMGKSFDPIRKTYGLHTGIPAVSETSLQIAPDHNQGNAVTSWDLPRSES